MSERDGVIQEFMAISGVGDEERAKFFLEAANWELSLALSGFFEGGGDSQDEEDLMELPVAAPPVVEPPSGASASTTSSNQSAKNPTSAGSSRKIGRIHDFSSNSSAPKNDDDDDDDGEDDKQAFYAGGGAHGGSGQQVLGPAGKKKDPNKMIEELFKAAKDAGAEEVDPGAPVTKKSSLGAFKGQGFRLGQTDTDHESVGTPLASQPPPVEDIEVTLKMWKSGFSVDDGELRSYDDPNNRDFLRSIQRGEIPNELIRMARGGEVGLNMEDHRQEEYVAPKQKFKAFQCAGQRLGSPDVGGTSSATAAPAAPAPASASADPAGSGEYFVHVDESAPTTNLQIRLADGSRLVGKFNHSHTVGDIRTYIVGSRPQYSGASFAIMTTFPNKELTDEKLSLTEANLLNAVIVMRLK